MCSLSADVDLYARRCRQREIQGGPSSRVMEKLRQVAVI